MTGCSSIFWGGEIQFQVMKSCSLSSAVELLVLISYEIQQCALCVLKVDYGKYRNK